MTIDMTHALSVLETKASDTLKICNTAFPRQNFFANFPQCYVDAYIANVKGPHSVCCIVITISHLHVSERNLTFISRYKSSCVFLLF